MANPGLSSIPPELVKQIVDDLPRVDLPAARFINKQFKAIAAPLLFNTIPLWISQRSLESLTDLSNHPELSFYVEHIVFSTLQLVEHKQEAGYLSKVKTALEYYTESLCSVALQFCKHRSAYRAYIEAQRYLAEDKIAVKLLGHAFKRFPSLFAVTVNHYDANTGARELFPAFGCFHPSDLLNYEGHHTLSTLISGLAFANVKVKSFMFGSDLNVFMHDEKQLTSIRIGESSEVLGASTPSPLTVKALELAFSTPERRHAIPQVFAELRELDIMDFSPRGISGIKFGQWEQVAKVVKAIIAAAKGLETLYIPDIPDVSYYDYNTDAVRLTMWHLIPIDTLTRIQNLTLKSVSVERKALVDFFEVRSKNLVTVSFWHVIIEDASWATVLDGLRALEWPHLQRFILWSCWDPETLANGQIMRNDIVQDYLLHKTDKNPRIDVEEDQA